MAKIYGLFGAMTGKVADVVMVVRNGEQIARKYQPIVSNPSSPAQVEQRAKMKLMSQLSAVIGPYIAMPRIGAVSTRNRFVKVNFPLTGYQNDEATISIENVQLTSSVVGMNSIGANRGADAISVFVRGGSSLDFNRVVYVMLTRNADNKLRVVTSVSQTNAETDFAANLPLVNTEVFILAYGVRDNTDTARAIFGNLQVVTGSSIASLITSRTLLETDVTLSETVGVSIPVANRDSGNNSEIVKKTK